MDLMNRKVPIIENITSNYEDSETPKETSQSKDLRHCL